MSGALEDLDRLDELPGAGPEGGRAPARRGGMSGRAVTRADLARAVHAAIGLPYRESDELVLAVIEETVDALARGENVKIPGFGTFLLQDRPERTARNPRTGEPAAVSARRVAAFRASNKLKARMKRRPPG